MKSNKTALAWMLGLCLLPPAAAKAPGQGPQQEAKLATTRDKLEPSQLAATLERLAKYYPEHAELIHYGKSTTGRPLQALKVRVQPGEPSGPLVAVVADLGWQDASSKILAALESELRALVLEEERPGKNGTTRAIPMQDRIWIPAPDPDRLAETVPADRPDPVLDFPAGWNPWTKGARTGPYPYSTQEAAALGALLEAEEALASVVVVSTTDSPWESAPGSLERFSEEKLLVRTERCSKRLFARLSALDAGRPRLALSSTRTKALGEGRWLVEMVAENQGSDALEKPAPLPKLCLGSARLVALAISGDQVAYEISDVEHALAGLGSGATRSLRLVIDVTGEDNPMLELCGPRWRTVRHALAISPLRPR